MNCRALLFSGFLVLVVLLPASRSIAETDPPPPYRAGFRAITTEELGEWIGYLASPDRRGRRSGEAGYDDAARYVASLFREIGLEPAGTDGYCQELVLLERSRLPDESFLEVRPTGAAAERLPLKGELGVESERDIDWSAPWVFAGYGRGADQDARDDFHGLPVEESVVLIVPPREGDEFAARGAMAAGARRLVIVSDERVKQRVGIRRYRTQDAERVARETASRAAARFGADVVYISSSVADRVLSPWGFTVEGLRSGRQVPRSFALGGTKIRLRVVLRRVEKPTCNVVGLLEGSDPRLKKEYVVIGAHLDHVGARGESIYAGADDNASGSAGVVAVAKALASLPQRPKRSVLFVLFAAEELGLIGSRHFVRNSPIPLESMVLMINLDMIGRNEGGRENDEDAERPEDNVNSIHVVGSKRTSLELDEWIHRINKEVGLDFEYDEERVWKRSDQLSFARRGVPAVFFFAGFHPDYHQVGDTPEKINLEKVEKVCRLVLGLAFEVAERQDRLTVNRI